MRVILAGVVLATGVGVCAGEEPKVLTVIPGNEKGNEKRVWQDTDAPRRHPDASFREVGDEGGLVVLPSRSEVKVLNPVGIRVFSLLDGKHTLSAIARAVTTEFEVDYSTALKDVKEFVGELNANGMLVVEQPNAVPKR